jgi:spore coat polysaccharide biosynthesis protein SpsF (cytidylyltransferase family)
MAFKIKPRVVCIIQARMSSTRLPGKVLIPLGVSGYGSLERVVRRCRTSRRVDEVVVASPVGDESVPLRDLASKLNAPFTVGPLDDVLERYRIAAVANEADFVVRVTSDCPLIEPVFIDACVTEILTSASSARPYDYFSCVEPRRLPRGLDVEAFSMAALDRAAREATKPGDREHVTQYLRTSGAFHTGGLELTQDFSRYRWTLDTPEDLAMFRALFDVADQAGIEDIDFATALRIVTEHPEIPKLNADIQQKTV